MHVYGNSKYDYESNILGDYLKSNVTVNGRNYFESINHKSEYGIWWDWENWVIGPSLDKGNSSGYARLKKNSKNPDNQNEWELYYGDSNGKPIWKKLGRDFGVKWKGNTNLQCYKIPCFKFLSVYFIVSRRMFFIRRFFSAYGYIPYTVLMYILIALLVYIPTGTFLRFYFIDERADNKTAQFFWYVSGITNITCFAYVLLAWLYFWVR